MRLRAEEEARRVLEEAQATAQARQAARNKAREEMEMIAAAARKSAAARAEAIAAEEARIAAIGKDEWFYEMGGQRYGPVGLEELRSMVSDAAIEPPVSCVFTEGMSGWKPVYEVRKVCEPSDSTAHRPPQEPAGPVALEAKASEEELLPTLEEKPPAELGQDIQRNEVRKSTVGTAGLTDTRPAEESRCRALAEAKALEQARLREAAEAEAAAKTKAIEEARAVAEQETRHRALAEAKALEQARLREAAESRVQEEARLRAIAEARIIEENRTAAAARAKAVEEARAQAEEEMQRRAAAEAKAMEQSRLLEIAEARVAEEARLRAIAEAKAIEENRIAADAKARAIEEANTRAEREVQRRTLAEAKALEQARLREAAEAKAVEEARLRAIAEAKAIEENRAAAAAKAKAIEEARICAMQEAERRLIAEAKAIEQAQLRAAAEAKAAEEARLRAIAEAKAIEEHQAAEAAKSRVIEEAKALAVGEARCRSLAEAKAAEQARAAEEMEALALEEERVAAIARKKAEQEAQARTMHLQNLQETARFKDFSRQAKAKNRKKVAEQLRKLRKSKSEVVASLESKHRQIALSQTEVHESPATRDAMTAESPTKKRPGKDAVWFYTHEGQRLGPVGFQELRALATNSSLDPRLDMAWKNGMEEWKPAGQIDGLFERKNMPADTKETCGSRENIMHRAKSRSIPPGKGVYWPGTRRLGLLWITLVFPFVWHFAISSITPLLLKKFGPTLVGKMPPYAALVPLVAVVWFGLRRLTNLGMSRWWYLAVFAPVVNLWLAYRCFSCPPGYASHKKMDRTGFALAACYWLALVWGFSNIQDATAPLCCTIDSVELPAQIRSVLHGASLPLNCRR